MPIKTKVSNQFYPLLLRYFHEDFFFVDHVWIDYSHGYAVVVQKTSCMKIIVKKHFTNYLTFLF
jgi:hypothetical protein